MTFKKIFRGYDPEEVDKYISETAEKEQQIRTAQKERIDELSDENYALRQQVKQYKTDEQAISKSLIASQHLAEELKFDAERYSDLVLSRAKIFYATWNAYAKTLLAALSDEEVKQFNILQRKIEDVINAYEGKDVAKEVNAATVATAAKPVTQPEPPVEQPQPHIAAYDQPLHEEQAQATEHAEQPQTEQATVEQPQETQPQQPQGVQQAAEQPYTPSQEPQENNEPHDQESMTEEERWRQARAVVDVTPSEATMRIYSNPISKVEQASGQAIDLRELTKTDMSLEDLCEELGLIVKK